MSGLKWSKQRRQKFDNSLLVGALLNKILPRWKDDEAFPEPFDPRHNNSELRSPQFEYFKQQAKKDGYASSIFYGPLGECVDWKRICDCSDVNKVSYDWGIECLASAADIAYRLGYGDGDQNADHVKLRVQFAAMAKKSWRPSYSSVVLQEDFGQGQIIGGFDVPQLSRKRKRDGIERDVRSQIEELRLKTVEPASKVQKRGESGNLKSQAKVDMMVKDLTSRIPRPPSQSPKRDGKGRFIKETANVGHNDQPRPSQLLQPAPKTQKSVADACPKSQGKSKGKVSPKVQAASGTEIRRSPRSRKPLLDTVRSTPYGSPPSTVSRTAGNEITNARHENKEMSKMGEEVILQGAKLQGNKRNRPRDIYDLDSSERVLQ